MNNWSEIIQSSAIALLGSHFEIETDSYQMTFKARAVPFFIEFNLDNDGGDKYVNVLLGKTDPEMGDIFHSLCELRTGDIGIATARACSASPEQAKDLYAQAQIHAEKIAMFMKSHMIRTSRPLFDSNDNLNKSVLCGIIKHGENDYKEWSESV